MFSAIGNFVDHTAKDVGHDVSHAAKSVGHGAEDAGQDVAHAAGSAAHTVAKTASSAAKGLFKDGKQAFSSVEKTAKGVGHDVAGAAKTVGHDVSSGAKTVGHDVSSAAKTGGHDVSKVAGGVKSAIKDGEDVGQSAAHGASSFLGGLWHSVASGGGHILHDIGSGASDAVHGVEHLGKAAGHEGDNLYHGVRSDVKQGLIDGADVADKLGLGSALDDLGLGGVNNKNVAINHHITKTYYNQSQELQKMFGPGAGANWATYASWASNRAGQAIQNNDDPGGRFGRDTDQLLSDIPKPVAQLIGGLGGPLGSLLGGDAQSKASTYNKFYQDESTQAAAGNQKVFHDIDPHLQNFINTFKGVKSPDQQKWNQFAASFHGQEGDMLQGFHSYYNALFEHGSKQAQSITAGNLQLGLHEQKLLQPNIAAAFPPGQGATYTAGQQVRVGNQVLALNQDVPADPSNKGSDYPTDLQHVTNPQLQQILQQWGSPSGNLNGSGAQNWANLQDRMKFISGLFMSTYNDPSLFQNPLNTNPM